MRIYIAGPMRGYPQDNVPAFNRAAARFAALGHEVVSPVEVSAGVNARAAAEGRTAAPEDYMRADLALLVTCDAIALLPDWEASTGARCEASVAVTLGFRFFDQNGFAIAAPQRISICGGYERPAGVPASLDALHGEITRWQRETFPFGTPESAAAHLLDEAQELVDASGRDPEEMADVLFLVIGCADRAGVDLVEAVAAKLEKNRARKWGAPQANGVSYHVEEAPGVTS